MRQIVCSKCCADLLVVGGGLTAFRALSNIDCKSNNVIMVSDGFGSSPFIHGISFFEGCKTLINIAKENNLFVIDGLSLVPHKSKYFADGLHPNDSGFIAYEKQLFIKLKEMNIL